MPISFTSIDWIFNWITQPTWKLVALLFVNGVWLIFFKWFLDEVWEAFQFWTSGIYSARSRRFIFLAVDVPAITEQSPAAMEAIFNQLAGAHGTSTWVEEKIGGEFQDWFSFEIVSLEGYVQYIIRCPESWRDLVEAAVYAQYPDAEVSEVKDYTKDVPSVWPNKDWEFFGTGYALDKPNAYPIKTYNEFEDKLRGELIDPMGALLEIMSKIGKGEQIWYQILAIPIVEPDWVPDAQNEINKMIDRPLKLKKRGGILGFLLDIPHLLVKTLDATTGTELTVSSSGDDNTDEIGKSPMFKLTPGERTVLEDMERKTGKLAYKCRIRIAYFAKHSVYSKARGVGPVVGAIKQFEDASKNRLKVEKRSWTKANYWFKKARIYQRQNSFYAAISGRSTYAGDTPGKFVLNSEELATIYHFPMMSVKAPLVKRTGAKKSEPPTTLPTGDIGGISMPLPDTAPEPPELQIPFSPLSGTVANIPVANELLKNIPAQPEAPMSDPIMPDDSQVKYIQIPDDTDNS